LIGDGIPFFEKLDRDVTLHLAEVKGYKSGMVALCYEVRTEMKKPKAPEPTAPSGRDSS
jgi:hypothetical protein